jgi:hypothetical protein
MDVATLDLGETASATATIANIKIEVVTVERAQVIMIT